MTLWTRRQRRTLSFPTVGSLRGTPRSSSCTRRPAHRAIRQAPNFNPRLPHALSVPITHEPIVLDAWTKVFGNCFRTVGSGGRGNIEGAHGPRGGPRKLHRITATTARRISTPAPTSERTPTRVRPALDRRNRSSRRREPPSRGTAGMPCETSSPKGRMPPPGLARAPRLTSGRSSRTLTAGSSNPVVGASLGTLLATLYSIVIHKSAKDPTIVACADITR
jgi:hypothetical protein